MGYMANLFTQGCSNINEKYGNCQYFMHKLFNTKKNKP